MDLDLPGELIGQTLTDIDPGFASEWGGYFRNRTLCFARSTDWRVAIEEIRKLSRRVVVADVGCGPGTFLLYLRRLKFCRLIGSDSDTRALQAASQIHRRFDLGVKEPRWLLGDGGIPIQSMDVDVVTAFDWLFEREALLPGFLVTVPARTAIISLSPPTAPPGPSGLRHHRTEKEVKVLAQQCGWWCSRTDHESERGRITYVLHRKTSL
jgi:SAM-dependent methyltransferase